ncbi:Ldh family oxidoreductase [Nonomuraea sp. MG754425]|uniref:Ldh family oxidoreductase n=1 Tax=Nonomuraea sp. MG754425 TaxID=2570319 RepID=UPI001F25185B|nr:Ldh family oxidoreductase [Nonomuraea sp. MG754425]MCF6468713.1 Ldh family oxidoreductase [Nonomuraea sp. MG754425]
MRYSFDELVAFSTQLFRAAGISGEHALVTARRLAEADLRGRAGHGLIRVAPYLRRIRAGGINARATPRIRRQSPTSAQVDGDNGLGQVVMTMAAELAITKAAGTGVAIVGTVNSNHAGAAGLYTEMAAEAGLVGLYLAVASANGMPPFGGTDPVLGPNPLSIAVPAAPGRPFLLDIATTAASHGAIKVARQRGEPLPVGWVADREGRPITDPDRADEGFLLPIGGHKGSGLTIAIGLLAGVLNGAAFGAGVVDHRLDDVTPTNTGQVFIAVRADVFRPSEPVPGDVTRHLDELRRAGGDTLRLPGDEAARLRAENTEKGVPVAADVISALNAEAARSGISDRLR